MTVNFTHLKCIAAASALLLASISTGHSAHAAELTIRVTGMATLSGNVHFGLFDNEDDFPRGDQVLGDLTPADAETVEFTVVDLAPGEYAVAVFHDANGNGQHDATFLAIEDFAFSRNARAFIPPPRFDKAAFMLEEAGTTITIDFSR